MTGMPAGTASRLTPWMKKALVLVLVFILLFAFLIMGVSWFL